MDCWHGWRTTSLMSRLRPGWTRLEYMCRVSPLLVEIVSGDDDRGDWEHSPCSEGTVAVRVGQSQTDGQGRARHVANRQRLNSVKTKSAEVPRSPPTISTLSSLARSIVHSRFNEKRGCLVQECCERRIDFGLLLQHLLLTMLERIML